MTVQLGTKMDPSDILMEKDDWALTKVDVSSFNSWMYHKCNPMDATFSVNRFLTWTEAMSKDPQCWKCQSHAPADVIALWRLHNWEEIQLSKEWVDMEDIINSGILL